MSDDAATRVTARIDALRDELVDTIARAVRIPSVNPKYPGQVYDEVVGGEGEVSKLVGEVYRGTRLPRSTCGRSSPGARTPSASSRARAAGAP